MREAAQMLFKEKNTEEPCESREELRFIMAVYKGWDIEQHLILLLWRGKRKKRVLDVQFNKITSNNSTSVEEFEGQVLLIQDLSWLSLILGLISQEFFI